MANRRIIVLLLVGFQLLYAGAANACPYCAYSPHNWGFCRYQAYAGPYDCDEYVADPWTGRTACATCGYCNWNDPNGSQACNASGGDDGDCGITTPCDQTLNQSDSPGACTVPSRAFAVNDLSWMDARADQVAIF